MRRIAMLMCLVLALGWISDRGLLSLKIGDHQIVGFPVQVGYGYTFRGWGYQTNFVPLNMAGQEYLFGTGKVGVLVNGEWHLATRLGNGWLFKFQEIVAPAGPLT
jgi:hypothetical protein